MESAEGKLNVQKMVHSWIYFTIVACILWITPRSFGGLYVTLQWQPSASQFTAGYKVYVGGASGNYTNFTDIGKNTLCTVSSLSVGPTYYFSVTAYTTNGLEGPHSSEVSYAAPASAAVTWLKPNDIVYGTPLDAGQLNATANVPGTFAYVPSSSTILSAGTGQQLCSIFVPSNQACYAKVTNTVKIRVQKAPLRIIADSKAAVYGSSLPALTVTYSGFVNNDSIASLDNPPSVATLATTGCGAGAYSIKASNSSAVNYAISFAAGTMTVSPASLTVTADNKTRLQGSPNPQFTESCAGLVNGDVFTNLGITLAISSKATQNSQPGNYPIVVSGGKTANYIVSYVNGALSVAAAAKPQSTFEKGVDLVRMTSNLESGGGVSFAIAGMGGSSYLLQTSSDLTTWETLLPLTMPSEPFRFVEFPTNSIPIKFYRVIENLSGAK